ncbi:MAG TPA: energy-coupling factor ABC transporter permease [Candidatus Pullilachnospira stercoravium]|uniref:Cobalt transport protein CbiM n=1 Tax=Candidatus Pullilachnospira stercoravium TaxID=2840913 RepID=A0A9D1NXI4_9FIRM|nr:energy-coupling factor ABC transporter permease [Candidatus Pullilachnospira stercoravium]
MNGKQKRILAVCGAFALYFGLIPAAGAMHIMEGYLPVGFCVLWGVICLPFLAAGLISIRKVINENRRVLILLAMSGAFIFVISSLKIPSWTGSCSHMTGTGLGAILFGPVAVSILGLIVLLFQAILLAHGGLTTLGANTFSMAVAGPLVSFGVYKLGKKLKVPLYINVFLAAFLGDLFTYCVTAVQLGLAQHADTTLPAAIGRFLLVFAPTQLPLAVIEGLLTCMIVMGLETYAKPELRAVGFLKEAK